MVQSLPPNQPTSTTNTHPTQPPPTDPSTTYLRFKHGHTTIFLFATPLQPFAALVADLLSALSTRYPSGLPPAALISSSASALPIPTSPSAVRLGALIDPFAPALGWRELDWAAAGADKSCMKAFGLAENDVVAFAFRGEGEAGGEDAQLPFVVEFPVYDEEEEEEEGGELFGERAVGDGMEEEMSDGL